MTSHQHHGAGHMMHDSVHVSGASDAPLDPHGQHGSCDMATCCPVISIGPRVERVLAVTKRAVRLPDLGCMLSQAPLDTSDKPPRHI